MSSLTSGGSEGLPLVSYISTGDNPFHLSIGACLFDNAGMMLVLRRSHSDIILPRGSMEPGEAIHITLMRELMEETGFSGRAERFLGSAVSYFVRDGAQVEKTTLYHLMLSPVREAGVAEGDDEFDSEICWINEAEALSLLAPKEAVIAERAFRAFSNSAS
jgi:8-oxo-dGTP pyrophosphatase MutT (NUDIX family)